MQPDAQRDHLIRRLLESFSADPSDARAFAALEEHLFLDGAFSQLAGVYEARLAALDGPGRDRIDVLLRLATLLDERLDAPVAAKSRLQELLQLQPDHPQALPRLRRVHTRLGELTSALQVAELEERIELPRGPRARVLAEIAALWEQLGDPAEANSRLNEALRLDPKCDAALAGLARLSLEAGDRERGAALLERRLGVVQGATRLDVMQQLASLLPHEDPRVRPLLCEVLSARPNERPSLERLIGIEELAQNWDRVDELKTALFELLPEDESRGRLALEAATHRLDVASDAEGALGWLDRALEYTRDDATVHKLRARLFRRTSKPNGLIDALQALNRIEGPSAMRELEIAVLHERQGRPKNAIDHLRALLAREPNDPEALSVLDRCLARLSRHSERVEVLERRIEVAESDAEFADVATELGDVFREHLDDSTSAEELYGRALARASQHRTASERLKQLYYKSERYEQLDQFLESVALRAEQGPSRASEWCELGHVRFNLRGEIETARTAYMRALESDPSSEIALQGLRQIGTAGQDDTALLEACEHELDLDPDPDRARELFREVIEAAQRAGELDRARRAAERWSDLDSSADAYRALADAGRALEDAECEQRALESLETTLIDAPEERAAVLARLGDVLLALPMADALERSGAWYRASLALVADGAVRQRYMDLCRRGGMLPELAQQLRVQLAEASAREAEPIRVQLARTLVEIGDLEGATEELQPAFDADPSASTVADLLEGLLAERGRLADLTQVLERRLTSEREPARRREIAHRLGGVLLDGLGRPEDTVATLRELADPSRHAPLEQLFERALEAAGSSREHETWLVMRESHVEPEARLKLVVRLARLQQGDGRAEDAIQTLRRAERSVPEARLDSLHRVLLELLRETGDRDGQLQVLASLALECPDAAARAAYRIERARLYIDDCKQPNDGIRDLDSVEEPETLRVADLRQIAALYERAQAQRGRAATLEVLATRLEAEERARVLRELAELYTEGPDEIRDLVRAEGVLKDLLVAEPASLDAFEKLAQLYERTGQTIELATLIDERLATGTLEEPERASLSLRLANVMSDQGEFGPAAEVLRSARSLGAASEAVDELLFRILDVAGDLGGVAALCEERARAGGEGRARWLHRWMRALDEAGAPDETRLDVLESLLESDPQNPELIALRLPYLRTLSRHGTLAEGLETLLIHRDTLTSARRRALVRELVRLYEGPLRDPERALTRVELELPRDPTLRDHALRLAQRVGDADREVRLLSPLVLENRETPSPAHLRALAFALTRLGRDRDAEPLLRRTLENEPRDREAIAHLAEIVRRRDDAPDLAGLIEKQFPLEDAAGRAKLAVEALGLAERAGDPRGALRWIRRWQAVERLRIRTLERRLELERSHGDRRGRLAALEALRGEVEDPEKLAPLVAEEAELIREAGQLDLARERYEEALRLVREPRVTWLGALDQILDAQGKTLRRSGLLRDLIRHGDLSEAERTRYREVRVELLAAEPELREEAAIELRKLIESDLRARREVRLERMQQLLQLHEDLGHTAEWCDLAEEILVYGGSDAPQTLERDLARRLMQNFFARERAVERWERILGSYPQDLEAMRALAELLEGSGTEARRASVLERLAAHEDPPRAALYLEAAELHWSVLRDAKSALPCIDFALALDPGEHRAHGLRAEVCRLLGRSEEETASLRQLLEREPEGEPAAPRWLRLAELLAAQSEARGEARECAERALATAGDLAPLRPAVCAVFESVGAFERVCDLLRSEIEAMPAGRRAPLLRSLARCEWDERQRAEAACDALSELAALGTLQAEDLERWAEALASLERWPDMVARRREALECRGEEATGLEWLELARLAVDHTDEVEAARSDCDRALARDPDLRDALALRAELYGRGGSFSSQLEDLTELASRCEADPEAGGLLSRAAEIALEHMGDDGRAGALYRSALKRDATHIDALLGLGEVALNRREWSEAERLFAQAIPLLRDTERECDLAGVARHAAEAALEQHRNSEAFRYLEQSLENDAADPDSLDAMAQLSLRLGAHERARTCLETRLSLGDLAGEARAERLVRLSQACEGVAALAAAADALEQVIAERPQDEVSRARVVDLLERTGEIDRALAQLDNWIEHSPADARPSLTLRAARLAESAGRRDDARRRLESLLDAGAARAEAYVALAALAREDQGASAALAIADRGLVEAPADDPRGALLWARAGALLVLDRVGDAARAALDTLKVDLENVAAAQLLAQHMGHVDDWSAAVSQLERALDVARPTKPVEAELWEALGRAYAGPLESMERADRCYRRALEANPLRSTAREALADITAFDPAAHGESVHLHRELLEAFAARPGSWRSIVRIAEHWRRDRAGESARQVLAALRMGPETSFSEPPLVHTGASENAAVRAATELLRALNEANQLPNVTPTPRDLPDLPMPLRIQLAELSGPGWDLADDVLSGLWQETIPERLEAGEGLSRRSRRQLQRALKDTDTQMLRALEPSTFREELFGQAAARAVDQGKMQLPEALFSLLELWPATADLDLRAGGDLSAAIQKCPPAQALLLRVADTTLGALGL